MFDQNAYPEVDSIMRDVDKYDLYKHLVDLQAYGLTVVPQKKCSLETPSYNVCEMRLSGLARNVTEYKLATTVLPLPPGARR